MRWLGLLSALAFLSVGACWASECGDTFIRMNTELRRLDGYKEPERHADVYRDGFIIRLVLSASDPKLPPLTVSSIRLNHKFTPGRRAEFAQSMDLGYIYGAGPATPRVFSVKLRGAASDPARWVKKDSAVEAKTPNFLDTADPEFKAFQLQSSATAEIKGTVLAAKTGVYDITLRVGYRSIRGTGECRTQPIRLYQNQDE